MTKPTKADLQGQLEDIEGLLNRFVAFAQDDQICFNCTDAEELYIDIKKHLNISNKITPTRMTIEIPEHELPPGWDENDPCSYVVDVYDQEGNLLSNGEVTCVYDLEAV